MPPPPVEPMLLFAAFASFCYALFWWLWLSFVNDDGIELRYAEE